MKLNRNVHPRASTCAPLIECIGQEAPIEGEQCSDQFRKPQAKGYGQDPNNNTAESINGKMEQVAGFEETVVFKRKGREGGETPAKPGSKKQGLALVQVIVSKAQP